MEDFFPGASQKHVLTTLKKDTYCFWFDGASNVQKSGEVLSVYYPRARVFHGSEHVLGLYFSYVAKLPPIWVRHFFGCHLSLLTTGVSHLTFFSMQVLILKICRLYNVFGCGSSHGIYAIYCIKPGRKPGPCTPE